MTAPDESWLKKRGIVIRANAEDLAAAGADMFCQTARQSVERRGFFAVAVSGGTTPRRMHRLLSRNPRLSEIPWRCTHLFWVDERMLPPDQPGSNFGAARRDFLDRVPIPPGQVHPIPVTEDPEEAAARYEEDLKNFFHRTKEGFPEFDLIFLGVGKDGHTASLFPGRPGMEETGRWVTPVKGGDPEVNRVTMTYPVLNRARQVVFLISGKEKAGIMKTLFQTKEARLPARRIRPLNGKPIWLMDREAASQLTGAVAGRVLGN